MAMAAFCKLVILLVTLVSFMPPRSSVSALRCIACVAVEGGSDNAGKTLEIKHRPFKSRRGAIVSAFGELMQYGRSNPSEDNQKCFEGDDELEAICGLEAIACVTETLQITDETFRTAIDKIKYHSRIVRRNCSNGPVHPECKKETIKYKDVGIHYIENLDLSQNQIGEMETCACPSDNCNLGANLRGISMDKLLVFLVVGLVFGVAR